MAISHDICLGRAEIVGRLIQHRRGLVQLRLLLGGEAARAFAAPAAGEQSQRGADDQQPLGRLLA